MHCSRRAANGTLHSCVNQADVVMMSMNSRYQLVLQHFVFAIFAVSLWGTVANVVPISVAFALLLPFVPVGLANNPRFPHFVVALLALYIYFAASTALYAPVSFISPDFYRRDGNFFPTWSPVILGALFPLAVDVENVIKPFLTWATICDAVFIIVYLKTGGTIVVHEAGIYHMLFIAHNAAGGFLGMVVCFQIGFIIRERAGLTSVLSLAVNLLGLILTKSRGSEFGVLMAVIVVVVLNERFLKTIISGVVVSTAVLLSFTYPAWRDMGEPPTLWLDHGAPFLKVKGAIINFTLLDRVMFLWPRAIYLFLKSPIFGTGFGSYNDLPYRLSGIPHIFMYNRPITLYFNSAHAHNTFLHVLAETGIVGLTLLLVMLYRLRGFILEIKNPGISKALLMGFWYAVFSSLTEHRLVTPAEMLPFTLITGMVVASSNARGVLMSRRSLESGNAEASVAGKIGM